ncbi:thiazole tautomerase TenI [Ammoniphilus sp. 3BR4]|uniref:thiazole tautomerase TenI n=1 Tax=Ammoniphilus sp. 3BR4 TaxID=3158265 RepID=UPI0034672B36
MRNLELHLISNGKQALEQFADVASLVHPIVQAVHLREKARTARELWDGIQHLALRGVPLNKIYLNDRADVAWSAGAKGVQLAYHSLPPAAVKKAFPQLRVGRSVHSLSEAREMEQQGADYVIFGHVFPSGSKPGLEARGVEALAEVAGQIRIPVIAIGGIHPENVKDVINAGAAGIAVMSGILDAGDPLAAAQHYREGLLQGGRVNGSL